MNPNLKNIFVRLGLYNLARLFYRRVVSYKRWRRSRMKRKSFVWMYANFVESGDMVFDIGANMGNRIESFLALNAHIIAVEPQPDCVQLLHKLYGTHPDVIIEQKALGSSQGYGNLYVGHISTIASMEPEWIAKVQETRRFGDHQWNETISVQVTTLDKLIEVYGMPAFCKIDVEGFEFQVLRGLTRVVPALSIEFTPETFSTSQQCLDYLNELGNYEYNFSVGESMKFETETWSALDDFLELLKRQKEFGDIYARVL